MSFKRHFLTQTLASGITFALGLCLTPWMTRIFAPSAYGMFAIVNGVAVFLATLLQFSMPSMLPLARPGVEMARMYRVCLQLSIIATVLSVPIALAWVLESGSGSGWRGTDWYAIAILPVMVASVSWQRLGQNMVIAHQQFNRLATSRVLQLLVSKFTAILAGSLLQALALVILLSEALGNLLQFLLLARGDAIHTMRTPRFWSMRRLRLTFEVMKRSSHFSVYDNLNNLLNLGFISFTLIAVKDAFSATDAGLFSLAYGIVQLPVQLVSLATAPLVYTRLIGIFDREPERAPAAVVKLLALYAGIGLVPFVVVWLYGPELFGFAFGASWRESGTVASMFAWPTFLLFAFTPVQAVYRLTRTTKQGFFIDLVFTVAIVSVLVLVSLGHDFDAAMRALSLTLVAQRLVQVLAVVHFSTKHADRRAFTG